MSGEALTGLLCYFSFPTPVLFAWALSTCETFLGTNVTYAWLRCTIPLGIQVDRQAQRWSGQLLPRVREACEGAFGGGRPCPELEPGTTGLSFFSFSRFHSFIVCVSSVIQVSYQQALRLPNLTG